MKRGRVSATKSGNQQGFVLVLTLWVMVIVAIAAGYFAERVAHAVELAQQSRQNTSAVIDMTGTRAEILYRLGTTSITEYGLGRGNATLYLDNRAYQGQGSTLFRLQDNRGLLNLNFIEDYRLELFLGILGIALEQRAHMIDSLRDYTDADKLRRLNGAEDEEYLAQNLPLPANRNLLTPWEVLRIAGWRDAPQLWQTGRMAELSSTGLSLGLNPNTAPAEVLATLPGISEEIAQIIIRQRKLSPILGTEQLAEITGIPTRHFGDVIGVIPSNSIRITQATRGLPWAIQYNITLTPNSNDAPWRTDYYSRISGNRPDETLLLELPARSVTPPQPPP